MQAVVDFAFKIRLEANVDEECSDRARTSPGLPRRNTRNESKKHHPKCRKHQHRAEVVFGNES